MSDFQIGDHVMTPHGKGMISAQVVDENGNRIRNWCVRISQADYQRNAPGIPFCDGPCLYLMIPDEQLERVE